MIKLILGMVALGLASACGDGSGSCSAPLLTVAPGTYAIESTPQRRLVVREDGTAVDTFTRQERTCEVIYEVMPR